MRLDVECRPGHGGELEPHVLILGPRTVVVAELIDRWLATDHSYFKVRGDDGATYILRHDPEGWTLTVYERPVAVAKTAS
jgi:hypothetical protein